MKEYERWQRGREEQGSAPIELPVDQPAFPFAHLTAFEERDLVAGYWEHSVAEVARVPVRFQHLHGEVALFADFQPPPETTRTPWGSVTTTVVLEQEQLTVVQAPLRPRVRFTVASPEDLALLRDHRLALQLGDETVFLAPAGDEEDQAFARLTLAGGRPAAVGSVTLLDQDDQEQTVYLPYALPRFRTAGMTMLRRTPAQ